MVRTCSVGWILASLLALGACKTVAPVVAPEPPPPPTAVPVTPLPEGETVKVYFQPPTDRALHEQTLAARTETVGARIPVTETLTATSTSRYAEEERGYVLTQEVNDIVVSQAIGEVQDPLYRVVKQFPVRVRLSEDGAFIRLLNAEEVLAGIHRLFPGASEGSRVMDVYGPDVIETQARKDWDAKYGALFGKNLDPGDVFYALDSMKLSTGEEVFFLLERKVAGTTSTPYGEALVLALRCLGRVEDNDREAMELALEGYDVKLEPSVKCEGQQVLVSTPFVPVKEWMTFTASPARPGGEPLKVALTRQVSAMELK
jgi:hypothetical protein